MPNSAAKILKIPANKIDVLINKNHIRTGQGGCGFYSLVKIAFQF
jgi:uncharacterized FAD-dependent dehydrogenase